MFKRLGGIFLLLGVACLAVFFTSSSFWLDPAWFLLGGIGFTCLGLLIRRRKKLKKNSRKTLRRASRRDRGGEHESP